MGAAFQQDVGGLAEDADAGPEDQKTNSDAEERIDPVEASIVNGNCAGDDGDVGKSVAEIVNEDAAEIQITMSAKQG